MTAFASIILKWYARNARVLPWRVRTDPYRIWISEVMLQQTRVATMLPYFERWVSRFPSVDALAAASERSVLQAWEGLGYYSRARNLHRAARLIVRECGGRIPADPVALRRLPGVGPYIAAAIASIAFGSDEPALDANVRRVLARVFHVELNVRSRPGEMVLRALALRHLPKGSAGEFNQALMDMGAAICLPRRPRCDECPVRGLCEAYRRGTQSELPIRARRPPIPLRVLGAAVVLRQNRVLVERRDSKGLLGGLWEFPKVTLSHSPGTAPGPGGSFHTRIAATYGLNVCDPKPLIIVRHSYSHFRVTVHAFQCRTRQGSGPRRLQWIRIDRLERYPMGRVDRQIAEKVARSRA